MADVGEIHGGRPKRRTRRAAAVRGKRKSRQATQAAAPAPAAPPSEPTLSASAAAQSDTLLAGLLAKRVRISLGDSVRWVNGYTILSSQLRRRASNGDARALLLLDRLERYRARIKTKAPPLPGAALQTPDERALSKAYIKRTLESIAAQTVFEPADEVLELVSAGDDDAAGARDHHAKPVPRSRRPGPDRSRRSVGRTSRTGRSHVGK